MHRGHDEKGNFLEILNLVAEHDEIATRAQNAKYTHNSVQNAIMGDLILSDIKEEILQAKFCSIIADEKGTDDTGMRYFYENEIHEEFLGYAHATSLDAEGLTGFILENLNKWGIAVENCISQSYDGTSVMSGVSNGVQARIREHSR